MTMTPIRETHIYLDENGTACVDTPRNKVKMLVRMIRDCGGVDETVAVYPNLKPGQLHAAMSYYYDHQAEIDEAMRQGDDLEKTIRESSPVAPVTQRLRDAGKLS